MNNNQLSTYIQNIKKHFKKLFERYPYNSLIRDSGAILSQISSETLFLPFHGIDDTVELNDNRIYYFLNGIVESTELSDLMNADIDYMFNMYLLMNTELFCTLIYIQCEKECFTFSTNRLYAPKNIFQYLEDII